MSQDYSKSFKLIHWLTALIILGLLGMGFYMSGLDYSEDKLKLYNLHKSFGLLVLVLLTLRILALILKGKPKSLLTHKPWEKGLSHLVHLLLYLLLIAMPLSGWVMSSAADFPISFFGLQAPDIVSKDKEIFDLSRNAHELMAFALIAFVGLHILGALKHHFIDRDETLQRMTSRSLGLKGGIVLTALIGILFAPALFLGGSEILHEIKEEEHEAVEQAVIEETKVETLVKSEITAWDIISDKTTIEFTATQYDKEFTGIFTGITGEIYFDPENLAQSFAHIKIPVAIIETGSDERDDAAVKKDWFSAEEYPEIIFKTTGFDKLGGTKSYLAKGELSIRGVAKIIELPFTLEFANKDGIQHAEMEAKIVLNRLDFGVGQGQWQSTDAISGDVGLTIKLEAQAIK